MADSFSFDIVSKVDLAEVVNAINQSTKEIQQRYDFKGSKTTIELNEKDSYISVFTDDEMRLRSVVDILQTKLVKRGVSLKALTYGTPEAAAGGAVRQKIELQSGIPTEKCKEIVKFIKEQKLKVQASIQEEQVRVSGAKKDDLQLVIKVLREKDFGIHMEFSNYR